jgi:predicted dehydrogenase/aryl-alcohol dehydrogenase-like predicted oxidoreductase
MAETVAWGIIGTGGIAGAFARGVRGSASGRLAAVGSRTQEGADRFGDAWQIPHRHASYEDLLADPDVAAVYVATPHPLHAEWAIRAAAAGKHVLCEKPIGLNHAEAMAIVEAARRHDVFLMEAFMYRCHPQTARLIALLQEGVIGEVRLIQAAFSFDANVDPAHRLLNPALGGGGILDVGGYCASMARLIAGVAAGTGIAEPTALAASGHVGTASGIDEYTAALLTFPGDVVAQLFTGVRLAVDNVVRIYGTEGSILVPDPWTPSRNGGTTTIVVQRRHEEPREIAVTVEAGLYAIEADTVAANLDRRRAVWPSMSWEDTLGNMQVLDQWRAALGVTYDRETPSGFSRPLTGRPLAPRAGHTMRYGQIPGVDKPISRLVMGVDNQRTFAHAAVMFDDFFERGGTCFDTAYIYLRGLSERLLGEWVRSRDLRERVVILDKGAHTPYCTPDGVRTQLQESLERLQTSYVDLYMLHRDNPDVPVDEFIALLDELQRAGRIRAFGASNWSIERVEAANAWAAANGRAGFVAMSNNFSLARMIDPVWAGCLTASDPDSRAWFTRTQMPLFPWSSQARGFFTERADATPPDAELARCWFSPDNFQRRERAQDLARQRGVEPVAVALAYVLSQPFPTFPLIGPRTLAETRTSFAALDLQLTPEELRWLNLEA